MLVLVVLLFLEVMVVVVEVVMLQKDSSVSVCLGGDDGMRRCKEKMKQRSRGEERGGK